MIGMKILRYCMLLCEDSRVEFALLAVVTTSPPQGMVEVHFQGMLSGTISTEIPPDSELTSSELAGIGADKKKLYSSRDCFRRSAALAFFALIPRLINAADPIK